MIISILKKLFELSLTLEILTSNFVWLLFEVFVTFWKGVRVFQEKLFFLEQSSVCVFCCIVSANVNLLNFILVCNNNKCECD